MNIIADRVALRQARDAKGLSRPAAAKQIGVSSHTIRSLERGLRQPSLSVAFKLAKAYDKQIDELVKVEAGE